MLNRNLLNNNKYIRRAIWFLVVLGYLYLASFNFGEDFGYSYNGLWEGMLARTYTFALLLALPVYFSFRTVEKLVSVRKWLVIFSLPATFFISIFFAFLFTPINPFRGEWTGFLIMPALLINNLINFVIFIGFTIHILRERSKKPIQE